MIYGGKWLEYAQYLTWKQEKYVYFWTYESLTYSFRADCESVMGKYNTQQHSKVVFIN